MNRLLASLLFAALPLIGWAETNAPAKPPAAKPPLTEEERAARREEMANKAWAALSLEDKTRALDWYRGLRQLPALEQKFIRERIDRYLHLSAAERQQIEKNYDRWAKMTPAERDRARLEFLRLRWEYESKWRKDHPNEPPPPFQLPPPASTNQPTTGRSTP